MLPPTLIAHVRARLRVVMRKLRIVSWNVRFAGVRQAAAQASFLRSLDPDIVLLQEVNAASLTAYQVGSNLTWLTCSRSEPLSRFERKRRPAAAIGGRDVELAEVLPELAAAPLPERIHRAIVRIGDKDVVLASYYAPPGVTFGYTKVENALAFLAWIQGIDSPIVIGADANSPKIDHPEFAHSQSWWQTGSRKMRGRPGDDSLWGPNLQHNLQDALRVWLNLRPADLAALVAERPTGPIAISHWTGKRLLIPGSGVARRYDSIWLSHDFAVLGVEYLTDLMPTLSDHAAVVADLGFSN
jgi:endonuclease/exonuclease/phosphatase family protein